MGLPREIAYRAVRVSLGPGNTDAEIDRFLSELSALRLQAAA
jgi:selenocysteine lyase/cysteine desulfurase